MYSWLPSLTGVNEYVGSTGAYVGSVLSSYYYGEDGSPTPQQNQTEKPKIVQDDNEQEDLEPVQGEEKELDDEDFITIDHIEEEDSDDVEFDKPKDEARGRREGLEHMKELERNVEKRMMDKQERVVGCFESGCDAIFGWTVGYRVCAGCERHYCYTHCNYRKRFKDPSIVQGTPFVTKFICRRCYSRHAQTVGITRNVTARFSELRSTRRDTRKRDEMDRVLAKLEAISLERYEKEVRKQKRKERKQKEYEDNGLTAAGAMETVGELLLPIWKSPSAISSWLVLPSDKLCPFCKEEFGYLNYNKYLCNLCGGVCCQNCCKYVSMGRSLINRKVPVVENGKLISCKRCAGKIVAKERQIHFEQMRKVAREHPLRLQVDEIIAMQKKLITILTAYFDAVNSTKVLSEFEVLEEEGACDRKGGASRGEEELEEGDYDEPKIVWHDDSGDSDNSDSDEKEKKEKQEEKQTPEETEKQKELHKQVVAALIEYQKLVKEIMSFPPKSKTEAQIVFNIKTALWEFQNDNLLPFQMSIPAMIAAQKQEGQQQNKKGS